jgi:hypothetical protein
VGIETEAGTGNTGFLAVLLVFWQNQHSTEFIKSALYPKPSTNLAQLVFKFWCLFWRCLLTGTATLRRHNDT